MIKVKICGITNLEDALLCSEEGADALGFIFTKKSPRYIKDKSAKKIISQLDPFIIKVGVFLDEEKERVFETASYLNLDVLQFHGAESSSYCHFFPPKFAVVKAFFPQSQPVKQEPIHYKVDAFLFDIKYEQKLKKRSMLPRDILREIFSFSKEGNRVIISGGLNLKNISAIKKFNPYAVDVCSGVEKFIGRKDKELVHLFIERVKGIQDTRRVG